MDGRLDSGVRTPSKVIAWILRRFMKFGLGSLLKVGVVGDPPKLRTMSISLSGCWSAVCDIQSSETFFLSPLILFWQCGLFKKWLEFRMYTITNQGNKQLMQLSLGKFYFIIYSCRRFEINKWTNMGNRGKFLYFFELLLAFGTVLKNEVALSRVVLIGKKLRFSIRYWLLYVFNSISAAYCWRHMSHGGKSS